jgi:citrate lyase synthetase
MNLLCVRSDEKEDIVKKGFILLLQIEVTKNAQTLKVALFPCYFSGNEYKL